MPIDTPNVVVPVPHVAFLYAMYGHQPQYRNETEHSVEVLVAGRSWLFIDKRTLELEMRGDGLIVRRIVPLPTPCECRRPDHVESIKRTAVAIAAVLVLACSTAAQQLKPPAPKPAKKKPAIVRVFKKTGLAILGVTLRLFLLNSKGEVDQ